MEQRGSLEWLEERGVGVCNIDQPVFKKSIRPAALTTSLVGYVRLHGRNYQNWFREKAPRDERYNYLYSLDELDPWLVRIKQVAKNTRETYVITNNHFRGQAVVNAVEIKAALEEKPVPAPEPLFEHYPRLADSATPRRNQRYTNLSYSANVCDLGCYPSPRSRQIHLSLTALLRVATGE